MKRHSTPGQSFCPSQCRRTIVLANDTSQEDIHHHRIGSIRYLLALQYCPWESGWLARVPCGKRHSRRRYQWLAFPDAAAAIVAWHWSWWIIDLLSVWHEWPPARTNWFTVVALDSLDSDRNYDILQYFGCTPETNNVNGHPAVLINIYQTDSLGVIHPEKSDLESHNIYKRNAVSFLS